MPAWAGKWKGGRFYLDDQGKPVFFIERLRRSVKLKTQDPDLALGDLSRFLQDPVAFCKPPPEPVGPDAPVWITEGRITLYLESIHATVADHRAARRSYLNDWAQLGLDLRTVDRKGLREALASFEGGHRGRTEALNAFARFLVREGDLPSWNPLVNLRKPDPDKARAAREAYDLTALEQVFEALPSQGLKDVFFLRVTTGLHHTEIEQIEGCKSIPGPLPDRGAAIRTLGDKHEIRGVLQVKQKTKPRHRVSVGAAGLRAALRLREGVPSRFEAWNAFTPLRIVPSNLRHTFTTLSGEFGEIVTHTGTGVSLDQIAEILGHRVGSKMTGARYDKLQIPPMMRLPLAWDVL